MPYHFSCDFSASSNPIASLLQAFELSNNSYYYFAQWGNELDYLGQAFSYLSDDEITIDCYQVPPDFDLDGFSRTFNQHSPKKITLNNRAGHYPAQTEKHQEIQLGLVTINTLLSEDVMQNSTALIEKIKQATQNLQPDIARYLQMVSFYQIAMKYIEKLRNNDAFIFLELAIKICESSPETDQLKNLNISFLLSKKASIFILQKEFLKAEELIKNILQRLPPVLPLGNVFIFEIKLLYIRSLIEQNKFIDALTQLPYIYTFHLIENKRICALYQTLSGLISYYYNQKDVARFSLLDAKRIYEETQDTQNVNYAEVLTLLGLDSALNHDLENACALSSKGIRILCERLECEKAFSAAYQMGEILAQLNKYETAIYYFRFIKELIVDINMQNQAKRLASTLAQLAAIYAKQEKYNQALTHYAQSFNTDQNLSILIAMAPLYAKLGRFNHAVNCLKEARTLARNDTAMSAQVNTLITKYKSEQNALHGHHDDECQSQQSASDHINSLNNI
jgi:tetratricopeptide (TPR) repeat protein